MEELPSDIIFNIFSRIPIKSLFRFRCVSKPWHKFIDDPNLAIMHLKRAVEEPTPIVFNQDVSAPIKPNCTISFRFVESKDCTATLEPKKDPFCEFKCKRMSASFDIAVVLGSSNGLLYFSQERGHPLTTLVVTNPLRKEFYELPPIKPRLGSRRPLALSESCGLGFDASSNTFKMVCVFQRNQVPTTNIELVKHDLCTMVHVLGTDSWREIPQVPSFPISNECVFACGCLHWLSSGHSNFRKDEIKVIYFDVKNEIFGLINPPKKEETKKRVMYQLVDLHGEVGLAYNYIDDSIVVWVLKEKEWFVHCRVCLQKRPLPRGPVFVKGGWNNDGDILLQALEEGEFFIYVLKTGVVREVRIVRGYMDTICMYPSSLISIHSIIANASSIKN